MSEAEQHVSPSLLLSVLLPLWECLYLLGVCCVCCPTPCSGVDDLLPIICYISVSTGLPQILSELAALQEFISDR